MLGAPPLGTLCFAKPPSQLGFGSLFVAHGLANIFGQAAQSTNVNEELVPDMLAASLEPVFDMPMRRFTARRQETAASQRTDAPRRPLVLKPALAPQGKC